MTVLGLLGLAVGLPGLAAAAHLGLLALASLFYRDARARPATSSGSWSSCRPTTRRR